MLQDQITVKLRHEKFIRKICETGIVYGLESEEGFATSSSNEIEDDTGEPIGIICFWSDRALANSCVKDDWQNYRVVEIPLSEFIENWCVGMNNDSLLAGTNFDQNMFGFEKEPLELVLEVIGCLREIDKDVELEKFENMDDLENQINAVVQPDK